MSLFNFKKRKKDVEFEEFENYNMTQNDRKIEKKAEFSIGKREKGRKNA